MKPEELQQPASQVEIAELIRTLDLAGLAQFSKVVRRLACELDSLREESAREQAALQKQMAALRAELAVAKAAFAAQQDFDRAAALARSTPDGARHLAAYLYEGEIIVIDDPPDEDADPKCVLHNCDDMGCGWCHVVLRVPHPYRQEAGPEPSGRRAVRNKREDNAEISQGGRDSISVSMRWTR